MKVNRICLQNRQQIVAYYEHGEKTTVIAKKFGCSTKTVCKILKEFAVVIRSSGSYRKLVLDGNYFEIIDTPDKAYWLGFIAADGCVIRHKTKSWLQIGLQKRDREHLEKLRGALQSEVSIIDVMYKNKGKWGEYVDGKPHYYSRLHICSTKIVNDLERLGICQRKSKNGIIPWAGDKHLLRHYYRGVVDGDGSIGEYNLKNGLIQWKVSLVGCFELLESFVCYIHNEIGVRKPKICKVGKIFCVSYGGKNTPYKIIKFLYEGEGSSLQRKAQIAKLIIEAGDKIGY